MLTLQYLFADDAPDVIRGQLKYLKFRQWRPGRPLQIKDDTHYRTIPTPSQSLMGEKELK